MPGTPRPESPRLRRILDRLHLARRSQDPGHPEFPAIPGAKPRPRFDIPEDPRPGAQARTDAAAHLDEGVLGAAGARDRTDAAPWAAPGAAAASVPETSDPGLFARPVYAGFMATVGVGIALLCWYVAVNVGALGGWITGAMFIALGLDPAVRALEKRGVPRGVGVAGVLVVLAGLVALLATVIIPAIAGQAVSFVQSFPQSFQRFLDSDFVTTVDRQWGVRGRVEAEAEHIIDSVLNDRNIIGGFLNSLVNAGSTIAQVITGTLVVLFLALYFLASLPVIKAWFVRLAPASKRERVGELTERITTSVGNYVLGQACVAILNATFALIVMLILGLPFPMLNAFVVLLLAFVPLVGGVTAGILMSVIALMQGWQTALIYAICYFAYLQVEAYFISPRIMKRAVAVPAAVAVIAVAGGGALWGVLGAIIAIPVAASGLLLVREVFVPRQDAR